MTGEDKTPEKQTAVDHPAAAGGAAVGKTAAENSSAEKNAAEEKSSVTNEAGSVAKPPYYKITRETDGDLGVQLLTKNPGTMPAKVTTFLGRLQADDAVVGNPAIVGNPIRRKRYGGQIISYGWLGLTVGDLDTADTVLNWFEANVADEEGPDIRRKYLFSTIKVALLVGIIGAAGGLLMTHVLKVTPGDWIWEAKILRAGLMLAFGNALGVTFFAFMRNLDLRFDQLGKFDPNRLEPSLRFGLVLVVSAIFAILLYPGIVVISLGEGRPINHFLDDPLMATIIGILCGYSDITISNMIAGVLDRSSNKASGRP